MSTRIFCVKMKFDVRCFFFLRQIRTVVYLSRRFFLQGSPAFALNTRCVTLLRFVTVIVHGVEAAEVAARDGNPVLFTDSCSRESPAKGNQVFESLTQSAQLSVSSAHTRRAAERFVCSFAAQGAHSGEP